MPGGSVGSGEWMLKARILTAVPLALILLLIVALAPPVVFAALVAIIALVGGWEWARLGGCKGYLSRAGYITLLCGCLVFVFLLPPAIDETIMSFAGAGWLVLFAYVLWRGVRSAAQPLLPATRLIFGVPILLAAWVALTGIHTLSATGPFWLFVLFALVWGADIGAYFAGRRFGRHKLAVMISPGKTWEGAFGGLVAGLIAMGLLGVAGSLLLEHSMPPIGWWVMIGVLVVAASVLGDLFESILKRDAGVKDSGAILPGHGGVLDRIDALLPAAPLFYFALLGAQ